MPLARRRSFFICLFFAFVGVTFTLLSLDAKPVTFTFQLPRDERNPFQRELWAEVATPKGERLRLPVYYAGNNAFAVRVFGDEAGTYQLGQISEGALAGTVKLLKPTAVTATKIKNAQAATRPFVQRDPTTPQKWILSNRQPFVPMGANLAWNDGTGMNFYRNALPAFSHVGLNWIRVWMAHWGAMNLDWLPESMGPSPEPGSFDLRVAESWDTLLDLAENEGVYVQMVLQYHGQYSTLVNSNWSDNPWNVANPHGFLLEASDFFTSPRARELTKWKYRYIIARWGASPAVMAWELFNEVQHTDALKIDHNTAAVAAWHSEMATYIRSLDVYRHLITTSYEDIRSPIYADLDFFQPHLYAANMLANPRDFAVAPPSLRKPIFYGEVGDDNMPLLQKEKESGVALGPLVWVSLMGTGRYPAALWLGDQVLKTGRLGELGAIARFLQSTGLAEMNDLTPFSPAIETELRVPLVVVGGHSWERRPPPEITIPLDGSVPLELANMPRIFVGAPESIAAGFPDRATLHITLPHPTTITLRIADAEPRGASLRLLVDGYSATHYEWPSLFPVSELDQESDAPPPPPPPAPLTPLAPRPTELTFSVPAGAHTLTLENPAGPGWFDFTALDLGLETPALSAIGRRNASMIALWVWHRANLFSPTPTTAPAAGTLSIDHVPSGRWRIAWLDTDTGNFLTPKEIDHPGGTLRLSTPSISRQAVVYVSRLAK